MATFVMIHSPVVGPTTWKWVADELRGMDHQVEIPAISPAATWGGWEAVVQDVVAQVADVDEAIFVAHSGAGPLLPFIVDRSGSRGSSLVFVDAGVPSTTTDTPLMPVALLRELATIAEDGVLPPWSEWFGPGVMESLIPDSRVRELIEAELPRVPLSYFAGSVPPVLTWPSELNGYILLSDGYLDDAEEARRRGWTVVEVHGQHLDLITKAPDVASAVAEAGSSLVR